MNLLDILTGVAVCLTALAVVSVAVPVVHQLRRDYKRSRRIAAAVREVRP